MLRQTPRTRKKLRSSVKKFTEIIAISSDLVGRPASNRLHLSRLDISHLDDELGRLRVWIGNIGGERRGHGSLEYRLREAPLLYENVHKTLDDIEEDANEILDIVSGKRLPYEQQLREGPGFEVTDDDDIDGAGDLNSALGSELENHEEVAEVQERISSIESAIDDLYKTAVYIRNPNSTIRYSKALTSQSLDSKTKNLLEQYRKFDIGHTREFFKFHRQLAGTEEMDIDSIKDEALIERLGGAITRRRHQFRYWRAHRDRLSGFNSQEGESGERTSSSQFQAMEANPPKMGNDQDHEDSTGRDTPQGGAGLVFEQRGSGGPQTGSTTHVTTTDATTFRPSARPESCYSESVISYATTTRGGDAVRFPPPPDGNKEFECPYCFTICPRRYRQKGAWKAHLLRDLRPYSCTHDNCSESEKLFVTRAEWIQHEVGAHRSRRIWRCKASCCLSLSNAIPEPLEFSSKLEYEIHVRQAHGHVKEEGHDMQLEALCDFAETVSLSTRQQCPICLGSSPTESEQQRHIAHHLERLASFALPTSNGGDGDSSESSGDNSDIAHAQGHRSSSDGTDSEQSESTEETASNASEKSGYNEGDNPWRRLFPQKGLHEILKTKPRSRLRRVSMKAYVFGIVASFDVEKFPGSPSDDSAGTAIYVGMGYFITCAHMVAWPGSRYKPSDYSTRRRIFIMRPPLHYDGKQHKEEGIEVDLLGTAFDETLTSASTIYLEDIPVPSAQDFAVVKVRPEDMHHFDEIPTLKPADAKTSKPVLFSAINGPAEYTESVCNWYKRELIPTKFEFDSAVERLKPGHVTEWITPERLQVGYCEANQATFARYRLFTSPGCSGSLISQDKRFVGIHVCAAQAPVDHESHSTGILIGTAVAKDFFRVALADLVEDDPDWRMFVGPDPTVVRQEYWPSRFVNSLLSKVNLVRGKEDTGSIEMKREKHGFQQDDMHDGQEWRRQLQQHQQLQHEDAMLQARKEPVTAHATKLPVAVRRTPEQGSIRELQHTIGSGAAPESTDELPAIREGGEVSKLKNFDRGTQLVYEGKDNGAVDPKPLKARPPSPTPSETSADGRASQSENFRVGLLKLDTMEGDGPEEERSRNRIGAWLSEM